MSEVLVPAPSRGGLSPPVARKASRVRRVWSRALSRENIDYAAQLTIILGIFIFFIQQYLEDRRERVNETLSYVNRYQGAELADKRFLLMKPWLGRDLSAHASGQMNEHDFKVFFHSVLDAHRQQAADPWELDHALIDLVHFFGVVDQCVTVGQCARQPALDFFAPHAREVYCLYRLRIEELRAFHTVDAFGEGLKRLSGPC